MGEWHGAHGGLAMRILASSGYLVLAVVLGFSGAVKLRHPLAFAAAIDGYRILPRSLARPAALAIALAEAGCAVLLAAGWARLAGLAVAGGLVGAFLAAMSLALVRGQRIGCGCFGGLRIWTPWGCRRCCARCCSRSSS